MVCGSPPKRAEDRASSITSGDEELHDRHAEIAQARVDAERRALALLREEEADVGHRRAEVAAAEAAQQREHQHRRIARRRVLHREADADRRDQQRRGRDRGPAPPAEDRHHERVEDAQRRAGQRRRAASQKSWSVVNLKPSALAGSPRPRSRPSTRRTRETAHGIEIHRLSCAIASPSLLPERLVLRVPDVEDAAPAWRGRRGRGGCRRVHENPLCVRAALTRLLRQASSKKKLSGVSGSRRLDIGQYRLGTMGLE